MSILCPMTDAQVTISAPVDEPDVPADWPWNPIQVTCDGCGQANDLHEQPPALMRKGVKWECRFCGHYGILVSNSVAIPPDVLLECATCSRTFSNLSADQPAIQSDGTWECPDGHTNRLVTGVDTANSEQGGS